MNVPSKRGSPNTYAFTRDRWRTLANGTRESREALASTETPGVDDVDRIESLQGWHTAHLFQQYLPELREEFEGFCERFVIAHVLYSKKTWKIVKKLFLDPPESMVTKMVF